VRSGRLVLGLVVLAGPSAAQEPPTVPDLAPSGLRGGDPGKTGPEGERRARIEAALREGAYDRAETLLQDAIEREPAAADLLRLAGGLFFLRHNYLNAAVAMKKAEALAPLDERSRFTLAMSYVVLGRRDWARPELAKLAGASPRNPLYPYWTARLDYDDGQYAAAVQKLLRVIELDRRFVKAHDNLGLSYEALGKYDEAIRSYQEAVRLNRELKAPSPWPPLNLGILLTRLDKLDEPESLFRESVRSDPRFPQGHYQLGVSLEKQGRTADGDHEPNGTALVLASPVAI